MSRPRRHLRLVDEALTYAGHDLKGSVDEFHAAVDALQADTVPQRYWQKVIAGREAQARRKQHQEAGA